MENSYNTLLVRRIHDIETSKKMTHGFYSLSGKTSYRQNPWSLEAARLHVIMIVSLWNLACSQIPERLEKSKPKARGFETSRDFMVSPFSE